MVAAVSGAASTTDQQNNPKTAPAAASQGRPPLLPSEKDNSSNGSTAENNQRKPKSRVVSSRYMSPSSTSSTSTSNSSSVSSSSSSSSSRRYASPLFSRNSATPISNAPSLVSKRSVSADRRRPAAARPLIPDLNSKHNTVSEISSAAKLLVTSTRSLSVSFQGEAFSLPISKTKTAPPSPNLSTLRKKTPERRRTTTPGRPKVDSGGDHQVENSKPSDQYRWPARNRITNPSLSRSMDCSGGDRSKLIGSGNAIRALQQSMMIDERRPSLDGRSSLDRAPNRNSVNNELSVPCDHLTASDSDSVSSDGASGVQECGGAEHRQNGPGGIVVSPRFWQETNSRLRKLQDPSSHLSSTSPRSNIVPSNSKRYSIDGPISSPRGMYRAASPSKIMNSSPLRGHSPSRIRNNAVSTISNNFTETPSVLSYAVDVRRGKVGENRIVDAHLLRLLYNRQLQWRFVNARNEAVLLVQKRIAEKNLWNAWIAISDLRDTVTKKRHRLQLLRQKLKLASILKGQMRSFEDWGSLEKEHSVSLIGAIEALKSTTLRLPLTGGAIANVQGVKDAIGSAVDVMQSMATSISSLLFTVEEVNSLVTELAKVTAKERALIEQCTDFISLLAAMQVQDTSLRTHIIQHRRRECVEQLIV